MKSLLNFSRSLFLDIDDFIESLSGGAPCLPYFRSDRVSIELQVTVAHLCCWGNRITKACLAVASKIIINTAKLLQLNRITNVDGRYSQAPMAQMQCCAFVFFAVNLIFYLSLIGRNYVQSNLL